MNLALIHQGKTIDKSLLNLEDTYIARLSHYINVETIYLPEQKVSNPADKDSLRNMEGLQLLKKVGKGDLLFLFDERGKQQTSEEFAQYFQKQLNSGAKKLILATGGAFGFSKEVYDKANGLLAISKMTFTHQMVRPIIAEQIYRAFTILKNEKYHH